MSDKSADNKSASSLRRQKRQIYLEGHKRKFLVVVDETPECESALAFAASRAQRTKGQLALLYVREPEAGAMHWLGVEDVAREEGQNKAKAVFRLFGRKLRAMGFEELVPEEIVREGTKSEEITTLIEKIRTLAYWCSALKILPGRAARIQPWRAPPRGCSRRRSRSCRDTCRRKVWRSRGHHFRP